MFEEHFGINHREFLSLAIWNAFFYFFKKNNVCANNLVGMGLGQDEMITEIVIDGVS